MVIAVIGGNGFIGSNLTKEWLGRAQKVYAVFNKHTDKIPPGAIQITLNELYAVPGQFDIVYLVMGNFSDDRSTFIEHAATIHRIVTSLNFKKIVLVSSVAVYGQHDEVITIDSSFNQPAAYGSSRLTNEFMVSGCANHSIIRFTYIYGTGMSGNSLIPRWIVQARENREITVLGDGARIQDYLHISDAVELCVKTGLDEQNRILLGATGTSVSNKQLAELIAATIPECKVRLQGSDKTPSFRYDISETKKAMGWEPKVLIEEGITELLSHEGDRI